MYPERPRDVGTFKEMAVLLFIRAAEKNANVSITMHARQKWSVIVCAASIYIRNESELNDARINQTFPFSQQAPAWIGILTHTRLSLTIHLTVSHQ